MKQFLFTDFNLFIVKRSGGKLYQMVQKSFLYIFITYIIPFLHCQSHFLINFFGIFKKNKCFDTL
jgi:hypothetical protein